MLTRRLQKKHMKQSAKLPKGITKGDMSKERLKRKNPDIKVMSDVNNFGYLQCLRTFGKLENDGTLKVVVSNQYPFSAANANDLLNSPTIVVKAGNVIGRAFTSSEKDRTLDESKIGYNFFWTSVDPDIPEC